LRYWKRYFLEIFFEAEEDFTENKREKKVRK